MSERNNEGLKWPDDPHNWPEDYHLENGNYCCLCYVCGCQFVGYKRRIVCKMCHKEPEVTIQ